MLTQEQPKKLEDETAKIEIVGGEIVLTSKKPAEVVHERPPLTERGKSRLEQEMAAGRQRVEYLTAEEAKRPPRPRPSDKEIKAQGSSVPVFRPGDHIPGINSKNPAIG